MLNSVRSEEAQDNSGRARVLRRIRGAEHDVDVAELVESTGIGAPTVRFHLDRLEQDGLVQRAGTVRAARGRPRVLYRAVAQADPGIRRYDLLASILLADLEGQENSHDHAALIGSKWGESYATASGPVSDPVSAVVELLDDAGFAPVRQGQEVIELLNCPFIDAVLGHEQLPCALHAGLINGALGTWNSDTTLSHLEPMARPGVCRATLGPKRLDQ
jgi:predicted ArsR family transcriptional regulator